MRNHLKNARNLKTPQDTLQAISKTQKVIMCPHQSQALDIFRTTSMYLWVITPVYINPVKPSGMLKKFLFNDNPLPRYDANLWFFSKETSHNS